MSRASSSGKKEACVAAVAVVRDLTKKRDKHLADAAFVVPTNCRLYQIWDFDVINGSIVFVLVLACLLVFEFVLIFVLVLVLVLV